MRVVRYILGKLLLAVNQLTSPSPIQRTPELQAKVDQQTQNLILYHFEGCPFCIKVRRKIRKLNLKIELRDAQNVQKFKDELIKEGGMYQTPCLRIVKDDSSIQWMYESSDIVQYLEQRFSVNS